MPKFIGEYDAKIDPKGRIVIPVGLKKQIPEDLWNKLVLNRGFEKCLVIYTRTDWEKETEKLDGLDSYDPEARRFIRLFNNGASEVGLDTAARVLVPKKLIQYAELESDVVLNAYNNKIEVWSKTHYDQMMQIDSDEFSKLAQQVMVKKNTE